MTSRIEALIARMTLEEKIAQLGSCWIFELQTNGTLDPNKLRQRLSHGIGHITRVGGATLHRPAEVARTINQIQRFLIENTRLGIPAIIHEESCAGAMVRRGTMFPQAIGLASTFEPQLAEEMAQAIREQLRAIGAHQALAPVLDVARDPRWGRVEETFGEDPLLVACFGVAYVRGLQGKALSRGVAATGKHFIGHSLSHGGRNCAPADISWSELYNTFLLPFQAAIQDAGLAAIMNAYLQLNGCPVAASERLLTQLLREELGFKGVVVSDYGAIEMLHTLHRVAANLSEAARQALRAGIDLELPTTAAYGKLLQQAVEKGQCDLERINAAVRRILQLKEELGLFDHPYVDEQRAEEILDAPEHRQLARRIAAKSLVLLKNDGTLPLNPSLDTIAVIGPNAHAPRHMVGDYSYLAAVELMCRLKPDEYAALPDGLEMLLSETPIVTILEGIRERVSTTTRVLYAPGCAVQGSNRDGFREALACAAQADVVVLALGDRSGLTPDCTTGEFRDSAHLRLPGVQEELAHAILDMGKPTVVVLVVGRPYAIPDLAARANAILLAWLPGEEGGRAIADALFGHITPGGKLPVTFPRHVGQLPLYYNHLPSDMRSYMYKDYTDESAAPLFHFGHGLSYTTFEYRDLSVEPDRVTSDDTLRISFTVVNKGPRVGEEVAQLYVRDLYALAPRPVQELKAFVRFALAPGEAKRVTFVIPVTNLAFYTPNLQLVIEPGTIELLVGSSSADIRLRASVEIIGDEPIPVSRRTWQFDAVVMPCKASEDAP